MTSPSGRVHSYVLSKLAPLHVDFVSYMDEVAGEVGARPSLLWLFFTDYQLFKRILWGPVTAYQYRLVGPGKWAGARGAIFTQFDRMFKPLKTREVGNVRRRFYEHCVELSGCIMTPVPPSPCPPIPPSPRLFQLEVEKASVSSRLMKLSLIAVAGAVGIYYVHVRHPAAMTTLLSKLRPQTA